MNTAKTNAKARQLYGYSAHLLQAVGMKFLS